MEQTEHSADANQQPFSVPEGYFDSLPPAVMQKIDGQNEQAAPKRRTPRLLRPIYIAAASLCAAIFGIAVWHHACTPTSHHRHHHKQCR